MSLHYLVKLNIRVFKRTAVETVNRKTPKCFCPILNETQPILIKFGVLS